MQAQRLQSIKPGRRVVTIKEVAARAKVSTATVSRVLAGITGAGSEVRTRVLRVIQELDYHPNRMARGLRVRQRKVMGIIIPDLQNPFFTGVVHGVETVLDYAGYTLLLGHSDGLAERELSHLRVFRGEGIAGLILAPGNGGGGHYQALRDWGIPVVAVDRSPRGLEVDLVAVTNREGAYEATQHLLALGHRAIGLINGPADFDVSRERLAGYREALEAVALVLPEYFVVHSDFRQLGGYHAMAFLLAQSPSPQAVLVANNLMTLGALQAIHERGLVIPRDLAVVGFDDMPWATSLGPPLTAVAQPAEELGQTAAQLLLDRLRDPARLVRQVILRTRLMIRASCGAAQNPPVPFERRTRQTSVPSLVVHS